MEKTIESLTAACNAETQRVEALRLFAWSSADRRERICSGLRLVPLTFRRWIDLKCRGNALVCGGEVERIHLLDYLWTASDRYYLRGWLGRFSAWLFRQGSIHRAPDAYLAAICYEHLDDSFFDAPYAGGQSDTGLPATEPIISLVQHLAGIARVSPLVAIDWPLQQGFAIIRAYEKATDEKYAPPIPATLNALQNQWGLLMQTRFSDILKGSEYGE